MSSQNKVKDFSALAGLLKSVPNTIESEDTTTNTGNPHRLVWKMMSDFKERTFDGVAQFLVRSGFNHKEAFSVVDYLVSIDWFDLVERANNLTYIKLRQGIVMPGSNFTVVSEPDEVEFKPTNEPTPLTGEDIKFRFTGDDEVERIMLSDLYDRDKATLVIWKIMQDGQTRTTKQIKEAARAMGVEGFDQQLAQTMSHLSLKQGWFDRNITRNEGNYPMYENTLRKNVILPFADIPENKRQWNSGYTCDPERQVRSDAGFPRYAGIDQITKQPFEGVIAGGYLNHPTTQEYDNTHPEPDNNDQSTTAQSEDADNNRPPLFELTIKIKGVELDLEEIRALYRELQILGVGSLFGSTSYAANRPFPSPQPRDPYFIEKKVFIKNVYFSRAELGVIFEHLRLLTIM